MRGQIRLVEAHDVAATSCNGCLNVCGPSVDEKAAGTPEHGHVLNTRRQVAIAGTAPVIGPRDTARIAAQGRNERDIVVGSTGLAGGPFFDGCRAHLLGWNSDCGSSQNAGGSKLEEGGHFSQI